MAAAAAPAVVSGRPRKRKSRRALAQSFLSGISLDGNVVRETRNITSSPKTIAEVEKLPQNVEVLTVTSVNRESRKPRFMHSISESAVPEGDRTRLLHARERSVTSALYDRGLLSPEYKPIVRRSHSLTDSTESSSTCNSLRNVSRYRITCMSGSSFRLRRKVNDKRVVLCSPRKIPFLTYSVLKYHKENQEAGFEGTGRKRASGGVGQQCLGIEGVEVGTGDKTVSYSPLLVPSYPLSAYRYERTDSMWSAVPPLVLPSVDASNIGEGGLAEPQGVCTSIDCYAPFKLDDPELTSGKHRTVLQLSSYMVSMIAYAKPSELKKDLNERFREKFPHIEITLTKLRSLKKDILKIATSQDCQLDLTTVAYAYVYFEKLIIKEKINKPNRKLIAGSCLLLAAKFNDDKRVQIKLLIEKIEDKLKVQVKDLLRFEFQALVSLDFNLHIPIWEVLPHLKRLESEQL